MTHTKRSDPLSLRPFAGEPGDSFGIPRDGVALVVGDGSAALVPRAIAGMSAEAARAVGWVQLVAREHVEVAEEMNQAVTNARRLRVSWASIGWCLGVTAEGARKAFAEVVRERLRG